MEFIVTDPEHDEYELLRESFRPSEGKVLFVGESRPAEGAFFYRDDSRLAKYTAEAMGFGGESRSRFLQEFRSAGCFLVDLCTAPVNQLPRRERLAARHNAEQSLAARLKGINPRAIIIVMKGIAASVDRVMSAVTLDIPRFVLPFPAQGHQREYVSELQNVITTLRKRGVVF
jgi:hypothetical protein